MDQSQVSISKFLSLVLRHKPEAIGLALDAEGWADITELLRCAAAAGTSITRRALGDVVVANDKRRFALSPDGTRIRASQGHSVEVDLGLTPLAPPTRLFHGTVARFLASIRAHGLRPGQRQHVHLSPSPETAAAVGQRRGRPVILEVAARAMHDAGHQFFCSDNGVWLTAHVPSEHIRFPASGAE